jgi:hypothetical protein
MNIMLATKALRLLVETINATGGLIRDYKGQLAPAADEEWLDLAEAYTLACDTLGVEPVIEDSEFSDEDESLPDEEDGL